MCLCRRASVMYKKERDLLRGLLRLRESFIKRLTCPQATVEQSLLITPLQVVSPATFFLRYLGSLRLFFTLVRSFLPPSCFQNKAPVSESMPHLVRATPVKHKAPGLRKFLTTLHPKQQCLFSFFPKKKSHGKTIYSAILNL